MPWNKVEPVMQRKELMEKLLLPGVNVRALCAEYNVSRKTLYKWLARYKAAGLEGLADRSKSPKTHPNKITRELEALILKTHKLYPYWGPRKLRQVLINETGRLDIPAVSTVARALKRQGCQVINNLKSSPAKIRFERSEPNDLWQMDFKGSFMTKAHRCYPLTILDDHSRYSIGLQACKNEQGETVKSRLIQCFRVFGLPSQINVDNGNPWGSTDLESPTALSIWLAKQDIKLSHSAPYHPQTNGKDERFHRTLKLEVLHDRSYKSCHEIQEVFDRWQHIYNYKRPHSALDGKPPACRYATSKRLYNEQLKPVEYDLGEVVRKVCLVNGLIRFKGRRFRVGKGLCGEYIAIREADDPDEYSIFFKDLFIKKISL